MVYERKTLMSITADCHLHTSFSGDSQAPMEDMISRGMELGLTEMTFTEHMDFDYIPLPGEAPDYFEVDTDSYHKKYLEMKERFEGKIKLNFGIELGMQTHVNERNTEYSKSFPFDFIIASSHLCRRLDPYNADFWEGRLEKDGWHDYFSYIYEIITAYNDFDIYGHLDYVLRYGPTKNTDFVFDEFRDDIDKILKALISMGKGIEANTSGYRYGMGGPHPCKEILSRYRELGGEILTVGSDAHKPEHIAQHFEDATALLKDCGFEYYCVFHERKPEFMKI